MREEILEEVRSRTEELNASDRRRFFQNLVEHYPLMPEEDRAEVDKLVYSTFLARTAKSPQFYYNHTVRLYVLDKYTDVKFRAPFAVVNETPNENRFCPSHVSAEFSNATCSSSLICWSSLSRSCNSTRCRCGWGYALSLAKALVQALAKPRPR